MCLKRNQIYQNRSCKVVKKPTYFVSSLDIQAKSQLQESFTFYSLRIISTSRADCASQSPPCHVRAQPYSSWTPAEGRRRFARNITIYYLRKDFFLTSTTDDQATLKITHHHSSAETSYEKVREDFLVLVGCTWAQGHGAYCNYWLEWWWRNCPILEAKPEAP